MNNSLHDILLQQKEKLIKVNKKLAAYFVPIHFSERDFNVAFLPINVFKQFHIFTNAKPRQTFISSGTTQSVRAQHSFSQTGLEFYARSSTQNFIEWMQQQKIAIDTPIISLIPTPKKWPQSSLAAMLQMFQHNKINIHYADIETNIDELTHALMRLKNHDEIVIFGTSLHHLLIARFAKQNTWHNLLHNKKIILIDTGGTKGQTRSFTLEEMLKINKEVYQAAADFRLLSEYGMCELASQAYSLNYNHDGWFQTNTTLYPFIIDLDKRATIEDNSVGFLAFIDTANRDSYAAILTEDLAIMSQDNPRAFKLEGRAPDASIKGCSLHIKNNFMDFSINNPNNAEKIFLPLVEEGNLKCLDKIWDKFAIEDLSLTLKNIPNDFLNMAVTDKCIAKTRKDQRIFFILPANIPICWIYPVIILYLRGAKETHLQLPSLRAHDPLAEKIRQQTFSLINTFKDKFTGMQFFLHEEKYFSLKLLKEFDTVIVFGSDTTITTFNETFADTATEVIGLGEVLNAYVLQSNDNALQIVEICSRWYGRGCLTPVALVGEDPYSGFSDELYNAYESIFMQRLQAVGVINKFFHKHALLEIAAKIQSVNLNPQEFIKNNLVTKVIDLRPININQFSELQINFAVGGSGLLFQITHEQMHLLNGLLNFYLVNPGLWDRHASKTWLEWIS